MFSSKHKTVYCCSEDPTIVEKDKEKDRQTERCEKNFEKKAKLKEKENVRAGL